MTNIHVCYLLQLENTLREINTERAKVKLSSDSAVAEASLMLIGIEEKSLELERNSRAAEAKLAEANRKTASLGIRLEEVEARESLLQKKLHTFSTEYGFRIIPCRNYNF